MPAVNTKHRIYEKLFPRWAMVRHAVEGESAVKEAGDVYLPQLGGTDAKEYKAYKKRALFFEATRRTLQGLVGMVLQKLPKVEAKETTKEGFLKDVTLEGLSIFGLSSVVLQEVLMVNKYGLLADLPVVIKDDSEPWLIGYPAESIINWEFQKIDGKQEPVRIVLEEEYEKTDPTDRFKVGVKNQYRVLELVGREGLKGTLNPDIDIPNPDPGEFLIYRVQVWRNKKDVEGSSATKDEFILFDEFFPNFRGVAISKLPFVIVTAEDEDKEDQKPPLEGLASVNMSHYRSSADLEHGRHFTALPTPYVIGLAEKQKLTIGASRAWMITGEDASKIKVGMLEFTGEGLTALETALKEKESQMARLGARLIEHEKKTAEAYETHKLKSSGEHSILASVSNGVSEGLNEAFEWMTLWDPSLGKITVQLNTEFIRLPMEATLLTAFISAMQHGRMSFKTFFYNMKERGMYPDDHTEEDELKLIQTDSGSIGTFDLEEGEEEEEEEEE